MSFMAINGIMKIEDLGLGDLEDLDKVADQFGSISLSDFGAGITQLNHGSIVAKVGRTVLFLPAYRHHFRVRCLGKRAAPRGTGPISNDDAGKTMGGVPVTCGNSGKGHDLQIIGMGPNPQMGGGGETRQGILLGRRIKRGFGLGEFHRRKTHREARR
jgi:hypothetical protein